MLKNIDESKKKVFLAHIKNWIWPLLLLGAYALINRGFPCLIRSFTGFPCPSCGVTRAFFELAQGHVKEAFFWHPLWMLVPLCAILYFLDIQPFFKPPKFIVILKRKKIMTVLLAVCFLLVFGVFVYRMILYFPDQEPLSYNHDALLPKLFRWIGNFA